MSYETATHMVFKMALMEVWIKGASELNIFCPLLEE